jgi:hypothetical protein
VKAAADEIDKIQNRAQKDNFSIATIPALGCFLKIYFLLVIASEVLERENLDLVCHRDSIRVCAWPRR